MGVGGALFCPSTVGMRGVFLTRALRTKGFVQFLLRCIVLGLHHAGAPLSPEEVRLAILLLYRKDSVSPREIAHRHRRAKSTIIRTVVHQLARTVCWRMRALCDADANATIKCLERMVDDARGHTEA